MRTVIQLWGTVKRYPERRQLLKQINAVTREINCLMLRVKALVEKRNELTAEFKRLE